MSTTAEFPTDADPFEAPAASAARPRPSRSDITRRWLCVVQLLAIVVTGCALVLDVENLLGGFPVCAVVGLVFAFSVRRLGSWGAFLYGISAPLVVVASGLMIAYFEWGPGDAEIPVLSVWWIYTLVAIIGFLSAYQRVRVWRSAEHPPQRGTWRFQIKFLLTQTVILSVLLAIVKSFLTGSNREFLVFAAVSAGIIFVCGLVTAAFLAELRQGDVSSDPTFPDNSPPR